MGCATGFRRGGSRASHASAGRLRLCGFAGTSQPGASEFGASCEHAPAPAGESHKSAPILIEPTTTIPLLVLDTNVVLDWVAFGDPRVEPIVAAIERGALRAATSAACLQELRRALGYPQVKLDDADQALAFGRYLAHAREFEIPETGPAPDLPRCEDPDDQKFLELAWHARASHLLTRDKALLKLARRVAESGRFAVLAPDAFLCRAGRPGLLHG